MPSTSGKSTVEEDKALEDQRQAIARAKAAVRRFVSPDRFLSEELISERRLEVRGEMEGA